MKKLEKLKRMYKNISQDIMDLTLIKHNVSRQIAELEVPFKEGQLLINSKGETSVFAGFMFDNGMWFPMIKKLKSNGEPYQISQRMWADDKWKKQ